MKRAKYIAFYVAATALGIGWAWAIYGAITS